MPSFLSKLFSSFLVRTTELRTPVERKPDETYKEQVMRYIWPLANFSVIMIAMTLFIIRDGMATEDILIMLQTIFNCIYLVYCIKKNAINPEALYSINMLNTISTAVICIVGAYETISGNFIPESYDNPITIGTLIFSFSFLFFDLYLKKPLADLFRKKKKRRNLT